MKNREIASIFEKMADILELKDDNPFKINAYIKAARILNDLPTDIEEIAQVPVMAVIPHDVNILKALSNFTPSTSYKPESEASREYKKLAATLIGEKYNPPKFKRFFTRTPKRPEINREIYYERIFK